MKKPSALYGVLSVTGMGLLAFDNISFVWTWLLLALLFLALTLWLACFWPQRLNSLSLRILQGLLLLMLAASTKGQGVLCFYWLLLLATCSRLPRWPAACWGLVWGVGLGGVFWLVRGVRETGPYSLLLFGGMGFWHIGQLHAGMDALRQKGQEQLVALQRSNKELHDQQQMIRRYNADMEKGTVLRERNRMTKQIHDTLGHVLTAIMVQLSAAELLMQQGSEEAVRKVRNAREQAKEGLANVRQVLSVADEDHLQFEDRLQDIIHGAEKNFQIKVIAQLHIIQAFSAHLQTLACDALREGLTNGIRHGQATAFMFRLLQSKGSLLFYLEDNGIGHPHPGRGYGLTAMEKQVREMDGQFAVYSMPDQGFVLEWSVPIEEVGP